VRFGIVDRVALVPYASNALDDARVYFEDDGGDGAAVVLHGGFLEAVDLVRASPIAQAMPAKEFRRIYVDHRGHGRSDKPHKPGAYAMPLRVADAVAVLDELSIDRAHFIGMSWGGRLGFGIGEHAPQRVLSLVIGGQQPYAWPDSPLTDAVTEGLAAAQAEGMEAAVQALEEFWNLRFPDARRARYLDNDPAALEAAWRAVLGEGAISNDLGAWRVPCLIFLGAADADFLDQARRAASEIPNAEFISLVDSDHYQAHTRQEDVVIDAVLRTLRGHA
jgi:pimeloyl-ACP methyl ester carboxylesterase